MKTSFDSAFNAKTKLIKKLIEKGYTSEKAISKIGISEFLDLKLSPVEQSMFLEFKNMIEKGSLFAFLAEGMDTSSTNVEVSNEVNS